MPQPSLFRGAFVFGLMTVAAQQSGLDKWGSIWAIVAGVIAATLFLAGIASWIWKKTHQPKLLIGYGNSPGFDRRLAITPEVLKVGEGEPIEYAYVKVLKIHETAGRLAREVLVRITRVEPQGTKAHHLPQTLQWINAPDQPTFDIQPNGHGLAIVQELVVGRGDGAFRTRQFWTIPSLLHDLSPVELTVEVLITGKRHLVERYRLENAWPSLTLAAYQGTPPPDPFPFPEITKVE